MGALRAHILLPEALVREIDALVGPGGRSAFLVESAQLEIQRRQVLQCLQDDTPIWKDEAHPDLVLEGTAAWVRSLRGEGWQQATESLSEPTGE